MAKTKKTIIVLGDSFIYGHGCKDRMSYIDEKTGERFGHPDNISGPPSEFAWPELLKKDHSDIVDVYNISMPGLDCQSAVSGLANLLDGTDIKPDLIVYNSFPGGRMLFRAHINVDGTPYLQRIVKIHDYDNKSGNWAVFRQSIPLGVLHAVSGGHDALSEKQGQTLNDYAGFLYHDALGVQLAVSSMLACKTIADSYGSKFIWAASSYCPAALNQRGIIPKILIDQLQTQTIKHINEFQKTNLKKYSAPDDHSNEQCHEDYYRTIIKPKIADLFR